MAVMALSPASPESVVLRITTQGKDQNASTLSTEHVLLSHHHKVENLKLNYQKLYHMYIWPFIYI